MRVTIVQPALAQYRMPMYRELASRDSIALLLAYGTESGVPNAPASDIPSLEYSQFGFRVGGRRLAWIQDQVRFGTRKRSDVLVLEWNPERLSLLPAIFWARMHRVRVVLWGHGRSRTDSRLRYALRRAVGRLADCVVVYESETAHELVQRGFSRNRVYVAQNALDQREIRRLRGQLTEIDLSRFRTEQGIGDRPIILHVSRLVPHRRLDILIRALAILVRSTPSALLVIIGNGADEQKKLHQLALSLGVAESIIWMESTYAEEDLAPWFLTASAYCFPEGIGLGVFHAFGYGTPVVVGDRIDTHFPEAKAIRPGDNAVVFDHGDPVALSRRLWSLISDETLRTTIGNNAIATVETDYTIERMADGFEEAIRSDEPQW